MVETDDYKTVRLPNELLEEVDQYVKENKLFTSRAGFIRYAIQYYLDSSKNGKGGNNFIESMGIKA